MVRPLAEHTTKVTHLQLLFSNYELLFTLEYLQALTKLKNKKNDQIDKSSYLSVLLINVSISSKSDLWRS